MSDRPIQVGDLVFADACGEDAFMSVDMTPLVVIGQISKNRFLVRAPSGAKMKATRDRLKRLDPDALKDDVPTREEVNA